MKCLLRISANAFALGTILLLAFGLGSATTCAGEESMRTRPQANELGIWKSYVPRGVQGEFNNYDPVGLMAGVLIHTDCSINWRNPDTNKLYCFTTGTSFNYFQDWPKAYSRKAGEALEQLQKDHPGS